MTELNAATTEASFGEIVGKSMETKPAWDRTVANCAVTVVLATGTKWVPTERNFARIGGRLPVIARSFGETAAIIGMSAAKGGRIGARFVVMGETEKPPLQSQ